MIYFIFIGMLIIFSYLEFCGRGYCILGSKSIEKHCYVLVAVFLTLFCALRYKIGGYPDWAIYMHCFDTCTVYDWTKTFEAGYVMLNTLFKKVFDNYFVLQMCCSIFCGWIIFGNYYKKSQYPFLLLTAYFLLHFCWLNMTLVRQCIAVSIIVLGMRYVENRRFVKWILVVVTAMQFHVTALIAFPLYFTTGYKISRKTAILLLTVSLLINVFGRELVVECVKFIAGLSFIPTRISVIAHTYLRSVFNGKMIEYKTGLGVFVKYIFYFSASLSYFYNTEKNKLSQMKNNYLLNFLIGIFMLAIGRNFAVADRLSYYYLIGGNGYFVYGALCNLNFRSKHICFDKQSRRFLSFIAVTLFLSFNLYDFCKFYFYGKSLLGVPLRVFFSPYKTFIF